MVPVKPQAPVLCENIGKRNYYVFRLQKRSFEKWIYLKNWKKGVTHFWGWRQGRENVWPAEGTGAQRTHREWLPWGVHGMMASAAWDVASCPLPSPALTLCHALPLPTRLWSESIELFRAFASSRMGAAFLYYRPEMVNVLTCTLHLILALLPTPTSAVLLVPYTLLLKYLTSE